MCYNKSRNDKRCDSVKITISEDYNVANDYTGPQKKKVPRAGDPMLGWSFVFWPAQKKSNERKSIT